eukprot:g43408.t1
MSGGGISLEVAEMASDALLDVDAGGMGGKDKGNPIAVARVKRRGEGGSAGDGSDAFEGPVNNGAGVSPMREERNPDDIIDILEKKLWMGIGIGLEHNETGITGDHEQKQKLLEKLSWSGSICEEKIRVNVSVLVTLSQRRVRTRNINSDFLFTDAARPAELFQQLLI